jgi:hypothetical protein
MELFISAGGDIKALYSEEIPLEQLGAISITRASFVEPDAGGLWLVDLSPVGGPFIGPFGSRSQGLQAERQWLLAHHLPGSAK